MKNIAPIKPPLPHTPSAATVRHGCCREEGQRTVSKPAALHLITSHLTHTWQPCTLTSHKTGTSVLFLHKMSLCHWLLLQVYFRFISFIRNRVRFREIWNVLRLLYLRKSNYTGITYINVGQNLLLLAKVWWHNFFIIIKSWFMNHFVVCNFLLVRPKDGMEKKARIWTVELFVVFFLN